MLETIEKITLTARTYWHAWSAIRRQYDKDKIEKIQKDKLHKLISYAFKNIKYYRELFEREKIEPDDIKEVHDLSRLPLLTKN